MNDSDKTKAVQEWRIPQSVTELYSFLCFVSNQRRYIKNFAQIAKCLHDLTKKNIQWKWTAEGDKEFQFWKFKLLSAPILGYPEENGVLFILDTDASN